jgi:hypothetical protein
MESSLGSKGMTDPEIRLPILNSDPVFVGGPTGGDSIIPTVSNILCSGLGSVVRGSLKFP